MRLQSTIFVYVLAVILGFVCTVHAVDTEDPFCEATCTGGCCNVNNSTEFESVVIVDLTYPDTSYTGLYTVLDPGTHEIGNTTYEGTPYQEVIRYENDVSSTFSYNVRIFSSDTTANLTCDQSHFYFDGVQFPLLKVTDVTEYCVIDQINGVINRTKLNDYTTTSGVYFAFNKLVEERTTYKIMFDFDNEIEERDDILDYQFAINTTTLTTDNNENDFFIHIDVLVSDINTDPPAEGCADLDTIMNMSNGYVYVDGTQKCQLEYYEVPSGNKDDEGRLFRYILPQSRYEECAESFTNDGTNIVFVSTLYTPSFESLGDTCYYFQPGYTEQAITITMDAEINTQITEQFEQFTLELVNVEIERCTPIENYIIPQATTVFTFNATFVGDTDEIEWIHASLPYLSGFIDDNYLYGYGPSFGIDTTNGEWKTCTGELSDGNNNTYRTCTFKMKTDICEKIYTTDSGLCGFETNSSRYIYNLEFREEYSGGLYITHRTPRLDTHLDELLFPESMCSAPDEATPINVNDEFPTKLIVRNYWQGVDVNWTNTSLVNFNERIALRLSVGEEANVVLNELSVMLKTVLVTLRDPVSNTVLAQYSFNVAEKERFMDISWSLYNDDPIFCAWYDADDSGGDVCQPFYSGSRSPSPWTQSEVDHVCKRDNQDALENNTRNIDYWSFDPKIWFIDLYDNPYLSVTFTINAVIHTCGNSTVDPSSGDRRRLRNERQLQITDASLRYVSDELVVIFGTNEDGDPVEEVVRDGSQNTLTKNYMPLIIGLGVGGGIILLVLLMFLCSRTRSYTHVANKYDRHFF